MSENEVITYLKDNRVKGVAFDFMPRKVQDWCSEHRDEKIFNKFVNGGWLTSKIAIQCDLDSVYCLAEDYEPKPDFKPHWEEFKIDKEGFFHIKKGSDTIYYWFNWQKFLDDNFSNYNNFGGWVYESLISEDGKKAELLVTSPRILKRDRGLTSYTLANSIKEVEPAYPTKILFWRYAE